MKLKSVYVCSALLATLAAAACEKSPSSPSNDLNASAQPASVTNASTGITLTAPVAVTPNNNQQIRNVEQPVTLTVRNGVTTGSTALTYTFEVATDAAFANKAFTKDNVAEGSGQTSLRIDRIAPDKTYLWRVRANSGSQAGPYSASRSFVIGPEVILQTPNLVAPANNGTASGSPTFTVQNVGRTGPAGQILYRFEVATNNTFNPLAAAQTVPEQAGGQTSFTLQVPANTPAGTYFWRVQASDPSNGVTSAFSQTFSFRYQPFDMRNAVILDSPRDIGFWDETAHITSVVFSPEAFEVDFDRRDGANRWRDLRLRGRWRRHAAVHARHVREPEQRGPVVLLGGRPVLVRPRAHGIDAALLRGPQLVLRRPLESDCRLSAGERRDRRPVRGHRKPARQVLHRRGLPANLRAHQRRARAVAQRRLRDLQLPDELVGAVVQAQIGRGVGD